MLFRSSNGVRLSPGEAPTENCGGYCKVPRSCGIICAGSLATASLCGLCRSALCAAATLTASQKCPCKQAFLLHGIIEHGITLVCNRTFTYRVCEFDAWHQTLMYAGIWVSVMFAILANITACAAPRYARLRYYDVRTRYNVSL